VGGLFRTEVLQAQRGQRLGAINLATPLAFKWWAMLALALAAAIVVFLVFGHYTRRETVTGQLLPSAGLLTVASQTTGTVTHAFVHEGERVHAGQTLVEVSSNLISASMGNTYSVVAAKLRAQEAEIQATLQALPVNTAHKERDMRTRIGMLRAQIAQAEGQLHLQRQEAASAARLLTAAGPLHRKGVVSTITFDQFQDTALSDRAAVKQLHSQELGTEQQLSSLEAQLAELPFNTATQAHQLRAQLAQLDAQLAQNAAHADTVLHAPRAGIVSTLLVKPGQNVATGQSLLSILPQGSKLQVQLLVPSTAIGFVTPGKQVVLHYEAFPYQKFGQQYGKVTQVSRSALVPSEIASLLGQNSATPLYRVLVAPDRQSIDAYGKTVALEPGMALSASILLDRRSLLQWAFRPLYGLRQELAAGGHRWHSANE
jgi:membrane fusion protein